MSYRLKSLFEKKNINRKILKFTKKLNTILNKLRFYFFVVKCEGIQRDFEFEFFVNRYR